MPAKPSIFRNWPRRWPLHTAVNSPDGRVCGCVDFSYDGDTLYQWTYWRDGLYTLDAIRVADAYSRELHEEGGSEDLARARALLDDHRLDDGRVLTRTDQLYLSFERQVSLVSLYNLDDYNAALIEVGAARREKPAARGTAESRSHPEATPFRSYEQAIRWNERIEAGVVKPAWEYPA